MCASWSATTGMCRPSNASRGSARGDAAQQARDRLGVRVEVRIECGGDPREVICPVRPFVLSGRVEDRSLGRGNLLVHTFDRGGKLRVPEQRAIEEQLGADVGAETGPAVRETDAGEGAPKLVLEVEEAMVGVEDVVSGVVEGDPAAEGPAGRIQADPSHRREVGEGGAGEEQVVVGRAPCTCADRDVRDEVQDRRLSGRAQPREIATPLRQRVERGVDVGGVGPEQRREHRGVASSYDDHREARFLAHRLDRRREAHDRDRSRIGAGAEEREIQDDPAAFDRLDLHEIDHGLRLGMQQ